MIPETSARQAIALAGQGQNVSEIARHLGHDRKTIRIYLNGHRAPGQPRPHADSFAPFAAYVRQRAADDPHLRSTGLHREAAALGYAGSYSAFTRELRGHGITAACGTCRKWKPIAPAQAREDCPGPLPFRTVPLGGETIASYLARVAAASHLQAGAITGCLPPWFAARAAACDDLAATGQPQPADIRHLAALTGTSETALRHALPALAGRRAPARPRDLRLPALRRAGTGSATRSPSTFPLTSGPADGTAPGSAASSRSTSPRPRTSPPPARKRPSSPASTASPGSYSPRPPPARAPPEARMPGDALRRSPWPAPASTPGTRTRPKQRPTPGQSKQRQRSSARQARCSAGRNNCQNLARTTWRANSYVTTKPAFLTIKKAHAGQRGWIGPRYLSPDNEAVSRVLPDPGRLSSGIEHSSLSINVARLGAPVTTVSSLRGFRGRSMTCGSG